MLRHLFALCVSVALLASLGHEVRADNLVVIGEDSGQGAVPRDSRPFKSALDVIRGRLASYDITVYDESSLNLQLNYTSGQPRNETEVVEMVGAVRSPPINKVGIFALYADVSDTSYGQKFSLRMTSKLLAIPNGKVIGSFTSRTLEATPLPKGCSDDCFLEAVSEKVESVALDLTDQISRALPVGDKAGDQTDCKVGPCDGGTANVDLNEFKVILRYPTDDLTSAFEAMAETLPDAQLEPISSDRAAQTYWLKTSLTALQLKKSLVSLKKRVPQTLDVRMDGSTFEVRVPN